MGLPATLEGKIWIPIFAYGETLKKFSQSHLDEDVIIFFIGDCPANYQLPITNYYLPWVPRDNFWDLIDLADISLLRGEISSIRGLMSGRPYIWDMYKGLGGWNREDSQRFLDFISASAPYMSFHGSLNTGQKWSIADILSIREDWQSVSLEEIPDFQKTLEKTIDKLGFSL